VDEARLRQVASELNDLLGQRKAEIAENYVKVREAYQLEYGLPEVDPVRHEVALCLIFGLYQAGITLTNHLLESLLKYALIYHHAQEHQPPADQDVRGRAAHALVDWLSEGKMLYGDKDLDFTINKACTMGLISKPQKKKLHEARERFRNAYSHADKDKTFGGATTGVVAGHFDGESMVPDSIEEVRLAGFLVAQGIFQAVMAKKYAIPYFLYIDHLARQIVQKLYPSAGKHERDGA
jgi:hypothetical protein